MKIKYLIQIIQEIRTGLEKMLNTMAQTGKTTGVLEVDRSRHSVQYYLKGKRGGKREYLRKSDIEYIRDLAQNTYEAKLKRCGERELRALDRCISILEKTHDVNEVYDDMIPELQSLVNPNAADDLYARQWQSVPFKRTIEAPSGDFITERNEAVRSKTELYIANRLHALGIPYFYEKPLKVGRYEYLNPDFTILNKRTRQVFLWEHLGRMGDETYRRNNLIKIEKYAKAGYLFGKNLLVTFESAEKPLSTEVIDRMIKEFFL